MKQPTRRLKENILEKYAASKWAELGHYGSDDWHIARMISAVCILSARWMAAATASHDFSQKLTRDALKGLTCCQIVSTISFKTIFNKFRSPSQGRKVRGGVEINPQRRRIVKSNGNFLLSGLPFLSGILPPISAVRLQRHLLLCQGWKLWSYSEDQKELPILQIQVRSFIFTSLLSVTYATDRQNLWLY